MKKNERILMTLMGMEIGGAETHVLELCKALKRKGMDVYVASNGGVYENELQECGITHYKVPLHNKRVGNIFSAYVKLKKIIRDNNIKLVHSHARIPAFLCGLLQKKLGFRFVTTAHWVFNTAFPFNILTNWGEKTLAVSDDIKQYLIDNYRVDTRNIEITINGIDTDKFSPNTDASGIIKEFDLQQGKRRILSVSRLDKDRSLAAHLLLDIAEKVLSWEKDIEIIIIGDGDDFDNVKKKADALNKKIGRRVAILTGSRVDINQFVMLADVFVNVSRALIEAMAAARPVIVAGNEGYIGIFDEGKLPVALETNFCCRGCETTTADKLNRDLQILLSKTQEELFAMGAYNRSVAMEYYSVDRMANDALALYESLHCARKEIDVMISGYYGFNNSGDDILLKSIVEQLKEYKKDIRIMVLSMRPRETRDIYHVESINRFDLPAIYKNLKKTNLLLTGGGSLVQDLTSTQSLIYYLWVINTARKCGAKNMLYGNGIGPVRREINKKRAREALCKTDLITLRDAQSLNILQDLGVTGPEIYVTADPAYSLLNTDETEAEKLLGRLGILKEKFFIIAVRSWKYTKTNFEEDIACFADYICETYGYSALFVPMQPVLDSEISHKIIGLMKKKGVFMGEAYTPNEVLGVVGRAVFVLGMRLHTIIYAAKAGTPVIGLVYDPKVKMVMEGIKQDYYVSVEDFTVAQIKSFADYILANRDTIKHEILAAADLAKENAQENTRKCIALLNQ